MHGFCSDLPEYVCADRDVKPGEMVRVRVTDSDEYDLPGAQVYDTVTKLYKTVQALPAVLQGARARRRFRKCRGALASLRVRTNGRGPAGMASQAGAGANQATRIETLSNDSTVEIRMACEATAGSRS
ncbi:hypothetical protein ERD78_13390 [Allopusillimonas soli]|nr:hypothetical protein ERD78_13390 [Allopusillimonas soli]